MSSETFCFEKYDCIGFDLDNTLVEYNNLPMQNLIYDTLCRYLVKEKNHSDSLLNTTVDLNFLQKGLFLDFLGGNVVKMDSTGKVVIAYHGTAKIEDPKEVFKDGIWDIGKKYAENPLETWNGPLSERIRCMLDCFDMSCGLLFARVVDTFPDKNDYYFVWKDILDGLYYMYTPESFAEESGKFFPTLKKEPETYIKPLAKETVQWIRNLRTKEKKFVFLLTGSAHDFASFTASTAIGHNWEELFDLIVFYAKKPAFFLEKRPFRNARTSQPCILSTNLGEVMQGNWTELKEFIDNKVKPGAKIVYVGDNLVQDVIAPVSSNCCDAVAITGTDTFSSVWGSYFCGFGDEPSFWQSVIVKFSVTSLPTISSYLFSPRRNCV